MKITKAVITAAGQNQRKLPLQTLIDRDGTEKTVLGILIEEIHRANIDDIAVVVWPGDEQRHSQLARTYGRVRFLPQPEPHGYGHAIYSARDFVAGEPFLHLVGDHLYVSTSERSCGQCLVEAAEAEGCTVSAVQQTRESLLPHFGAVGGRRVPRRQDLYRIETVIEKPTPTEAEQRLMVPGLRTGHYLCFFGMHVLTASVMEILSGIVALQAGQGGVLLSTALAAAAGRERYLACELKGRRYNIGAKYGLLIAQLALAFEGRDRDEVLADLVELLALRGR